MRANSTSSEVHCMRAHSTSSGANQGVSSEIQNTHTRSVPTLNSEFFCGRCIEAVLHDLHVNGYVKVGPDEAILNRTILDLIIIDRLGHLKDNSLSSKLQVGTNVPIITRTDHMYGRTRVVKGRCDWALAHGEDKSHTGSILIVVQAKGVGDAFIGMPQLLFYLHAVQEAREKLNRRVCTVLGMLSDGTHFKFCALQNDKKFLVGPPLHWGFDKDNILQHIDTILHDTITSSPVTTNCFTIRRDGRYSKKNWKTRKTRKKQNNV